MLLQTSAFAAQPSRIGAVMTDVRGRISLGVLRPGARLPSIRGCAEALGVSKSTVVEAYERLIAEGEITARPGSGFYVAARTRSLSLAEAVPRVEREIDPLWVMRQSLEADDSAQKPGCGWLPESWMPVDAIRRALRAEARGPSMSLVNYGSPRGFEPLREHFAHRLADRGIVASPDQILLTDSGTQAIDLLCRLFVQPGDTVVVDDPCYFNFLNIARAHRAKVVGVPYTPTGPNLAVFAQILIEHKPRIYLTTGALHNPTGATPSAAVQHRILKLAEAHDLIVVEDDIFADFEPEPTTKLAAFDGLERVVHIGSCSKTLSASLRCGFIVARPDWIEALADLRLSTTFAGNELAARVVHRLLVDGSYRRHMDATRGKLARAQTATSAGLTDAGLRLWTEPRGGLFLWAELPGGLDAADVTRLAMREGVVLAPGDVFSVNRSAGGFLRFNVSQCADPKIFEILTRSIRVARA